MKHASDLHCLMQMSGVQCNAIMIGSVSLAHEPLITLVEHMSLKELTQVAHGIKIIYGIEVIQAMALDIITSSLMIYLANVDQSPNNNTMTRT